MTHISAWYRISTAALLVAICMPLLPASFTRPAFNLATSSARRFTTVNPIALQSAPLATTLSGIALFSTSKQSNADMAAPKVTKSDQEWRAILSPEQFRVIRQKGTERPGSHKYDHSFDKGVYREF